MDPSKKGLLKTNEYETRDSFESDIDSIPLLEDGKRQQQQHGFAKRLWPKSKCARITLALVAICVVLFSATGLFGYEKYKEEPPYGQSPPWYPSPRGGTARQWADSYEKAARMVSRMTLPEKVNVTTGTGWGMGLAVGSTGPAVRVGFPGLALQDGPLGIRKADNITAFPAGITVGATWNKDLMYERGRAHALEAIGKGINVLLGPCVGPLGRMPAGGRNWEGFGSDPYLQGVAGAKTIAGIQDQGVMATIKHFIANEQEHFRQPWEWGLPHAISSNVGDRAMHEMYAWPFADAVRAGVASVMCSYNMVNNSYACGNSKLLNGVLKDEMGFQGFVMSDWLAQRSGVASALSGLDMTMPGDGLRWADGDSLWGPHLSRAVLNESLPLERLNDMVTRVVAAWYQLGQDSDERFDFDGPNFSSFSDEKMGYMAPESPSDQDLVEVNKFVDVQGDHNLIARAVAVEGTVLLKNDGILPLTRDGGMGPEKRRVRGKGKLRVGVFGEDAGPGKGPNHCADRGCNDGTLGSGWGSGAVEFPFLVTPAEALREGFNKEKVEVAEFLDNSLRHAESPRDLEDQDVCIVFVNSDAGEGFIAWGEVAGDRNDLNLQKGGDELVVEVATHCGGGSGSTIVVIHAVGPVLVERWADLPGVKAVLHAHLPGEESGNALASVLFGDESPSGKLPYTIAKSLDDYGPGGKILYAPNGAVPQQDFDEGLYIDYRYLDKHGIRPRYEFGFGLSYTAFEYGDLRITERKAKSALPAKRPDASATPPEYSRDVPPAEEAVFPGGDDKIRRLEGYIYPYIEPGEDVGKGGYPYPDGYDARAPLSEAGGGQGGNPDLWETHVSVAVTVKNVGRVAGSAVPQLYMSYPKSPALLSSGGGEVDFPVRVLRGFEKVRLEAGESRTVEFEVTRRDLSYWDVERQNWVMVLGEGGEEEGKYTFAVGESSRDVRVSGKW